MPKWIFLSVQDWTRIKAARAALRSEGQRLKAAELAFQGIQEGRKAGLYTVIEALNASDHISRAQLSMANI